MKRITWTVLAVLIGLCLVWGATIPSWWNKPWAELQTWQKIVKVRARYQRLLHAKTLECEELRARVVGLEVQLFELQAENVELRTNPIWWYYASDGYMPEWLRRWNDEWEERYEALVLFEDLD